MVEGTPGWEQTNLLGLSFPPDPRPRRTGKATAPVAQGAVTMGEAPGREQSVVEDPNPLAADSIAEELVEEAPAPMRFAPPISLPGFARAAVHSPPQVPERLLILDTETTALHPEEGSCIEVGAVLFHVPSRSVLTQVSFLLPCQTNAAEVVNGIPASVSQLEQPWPEALRCFLAMAAMADAILAHNAAFDRQWFGREPLPALDQPWICSMDDISWPAGLHLRQGPSVRDLAIAHGVPVWAAHRALTDCTYLVQVLQRCENLEGLLRAALEPRRLYRAQLSYSERHQAKAAGFRWNDPVPGAWSKRLTEREVSALPFPVNPVTRC